MDRMLGLCDGSNYFSAPVGEKRGPIGSDDRDSVGREDNAAWREDNSAWCESSFESASSGIGESISSRIPVLDCPERA